MVRAGTFVGTLMGVGFLLQIEGLQRTTASRSGFLTGTLVVLVPLIELAIFRKRPALPATVGVMLAFVGITVLSAPWSNASHTTWAGDALTLGCALVFAAHVVALGRVAAKHPVSSMLLLQLATTGVLAALAGPMVEAQHFCMMMRGVQKQHSGTVTSTMLGAFRDNKETRDEFLSLIRKS